MDAVERVSEPSPRSSKRVLLFTGSDAYKPGFYRAAWVGFWTRALRQALPALALEWKLKEEISE